MDDQSNTVERPEGFWLFLPGARHQLCTIVALIGFISGAAQLSGATFTVNTTADNGTGSLREAIELANAAGPGPHTIDFSVNGTITLASELPLIDNSVNITGPGAGNLAVSGANQHRVFFVNSGTVAINDLTIHRPGRWWRHLRQLGSSSLAHQCAPDR
jgi:hypothetical protein